MLYILLIAPPESLDLPLIKEILFKKIFELADNILTSLLPFSV